MSVECIIEVDEMRRVFEKGREVGRRRGSKVIV